MSSKEYPFVGDQTTPLIVGKKYKVKCVKMHISTDFGPKDIWVPTLCDHVGEFSKEHHYHLDDRFVSAIVYEYIKVEPYSVVGFEANGQEEEIQVHKCLRQFSNKFVIPADQKEYAKEVSIFLSDRCKNKKVKSCMKCPHQGVELSQVPIIDGVRVCPAHCLKWDAEDGTFAGSALL